MSEENDSITWQGGECPVDTDTLVQVLISCKDGTVTAEAGSFTWQRTNYAGDIIAYRAVEAPKPKVEIPEGFTPWSGGKCPVDAGAEIGVILRNGSQGSGLAGGHRWTHGQNLGDIIAYRVIEGEKPKAQTARDTQVGGEHYKKSTVQPWDVVDTWPIDQQIGFHRGNALKYVMRMGTKDENLREIRKAAHYLQKLVEVLEQKGGAQ